MPDPSPHSQVERRWTIYNYANSGWRLLDPDGEYAPGKATPTLEVMPVSEHEAREAELEKERDSYKREIERRGRSESNRSQPTVIAGVASMHAHPTGDWVRYLDHDAEVASWITATDEADEKRHLEKQRAENSERLLADARAELERREKEANSKLRAKLAAGDKTHPLDRERGRAFYEAAALLTATPCSDQGGDASESRKTDRDCTDVTRGGPEPDGGLAPATSKLDNSENRLDMLDLVGEIEDAETSLCSDREGEFRDSLAWAIRWIEYCSEEPLEDFETGGKDEAEARAKFDAAKALLAAPTQPAVPVPQEAESDRNTSSQSDHPPKNDPNGAESGPQEGSEDWPEAIWRIQIDHLLNPPAFHTDSLREATGWSDTGAHVRRYIPAPDSDECPRSPDGCHAFEDHGGGAIKCMVCGAAPDSPGLGGDGR
jgi:hypothetical protein